MPRPEPTTAKTPSPMVIARSRRGVSQVRAWRPSQARIPEAEPIAVAAPAAHCMHMGANRSELGAAATLGDDVAKVFDEISDHMRGWIERQALFFVASAPLSPDGHVNVSPKGPIGSFAVLDARTVAYLDVHGSGAETVAHLRENGRICVMFCSFDGTPNVVRLHGRGRVVTHGEPGFDAALEPFAMGLASRRTEARGVITVEVTRVSDACGFAVPRMALEGDRELLDSWTENRDADRLRVYRAEKNEHSLDGLPGLAGLPGW